MHKTQAKIPKEIDKEKDDDVDPFEGIDGVDSFSDSGE